MARKAQRRTKVLAASAPNESALWTPLAPIAQSSLAFWNTFLGLRMGPNNDLLLDASALARLGKIVRAVSWVESKHGTGGVNQPARDPMQCGNPGDVWWRELTGQLTPEDVLTRSPGLTNLRASQLPGAAEPSAGFPPAARISALADKTLGHRGASYTRNHSFLWSFPYLLHRTNVPASGKTFRCGDTARGRLINGAVAYNGGGDPNYRSKIEQALALIGDIADPMHFLATASAELFRGDTDLATDARPEPDHHEDPEHITGDADVAAPSHAKTLLAAATAPLELSGPQWVARFPGSRSTADLTVDFKASVEAFLRALAAAGASVTISATYRPPERAYLMHFAWGIARNNDDPTTVPPMPGVNIQWAHRNASGQVDRAASKQAAEKMVEGYALSVQAVLRSRHTERRAIDMSISWSGTLNITNATGQVVSIGDPRSGQNSQLHVVGRTFGVIKLVDDKPHWSDDGH